MKHPFFFLAGIILSVLFVIFPVFAAGGEADGGGMQNLNVGMHWAGIVCIVIFIVSYLAVLAEEYTHMRKSKPVLFGAGLMWVVIGMIAPQYGVDHHGVRDAVFHGLEEYASLMLFLLSAMTYIAALEDRNVFDVIRVKLVGSGMSFRQLFWVTGFIAFFLSPIADNLTTALVMGAVILAVGRGNGAFISIGCINVVSAANAGGAFSPFGDITTLMVWQAEKVEFFEFFVLFVPSLINFVVPAAIMTFFIPAGVKPDAPDEQVQLKYGATPIIFLGFLTIAMAVSFEQFLGLPPFIGMMTGLSFLMIASWYIQHRGSRQDKDFDIFTQVAAAEWDTLLFFFGVIFSVGGLGYLGYLELMSSSFYQGFGPGMTNIGLGFVSAIVDNIPVMFAVLTMNPDMDHFQWLLITLTTGVGGTMLSIGSAAGVALMGTARGYYTFFSHLKWTPVLIVGYAAAIAMHYSLNAHLMEVVK
ncbi:MAG: sodium:proton antiporter NhaD [Alphaproteobacteria bacterium]|nr:sodium:proton antiporter NhaD [Alphaproteobacteria bacterium]MCB9974602.1 sodium:proton antiporter NhaD [Rhodospirillales bacterium]